MTAKRIFDTNVVIYAYDDSEPTKQAVARSLLLNAAATTTGVISTQVLGEFFHATVVRRPLLTVATLAQHCGPCPVSTWRQFRHRS